MLSMRQLVLFVALPLAAQPAAQSVAPGGATRADHRVSIGKAPKALPLATIQSGAGMALNGVQTPAGVNSLIVAPGDLVETFDTPALVRFADGRTLTLAARTRYIVPSTPSNPFRSIGSAPSRWSPMLLKPLSVHKPS